MKDTGTDPDEVTIGGTVVRGVGVDAQSRCAHYASALDIVAIRFPCCGAYYSCYRCHEALAGHAPRRWPEAEFDAAAILCGNCGADLSVRQYLACEDRCPHCAAPFNPGCASHQSLYFEA